MSEHNYSFDDIAWQKIAPHLKAMNVATEHNPYLSFENGILYYSEEMPSSEAVRRNICDLISILGGQETPIKQKENII